MCIQQILLGIIGFILGISAFLLVLYVIGRLASLFPALGFKDPYNGFIDHVFHGALTIIGLILITTTILTIAAIIIMIGNLFNVCIN